MIEQSEKELFSEEKFNLRNTVDNLRQMADILRAIDKGTMPVSEQTKKAIQTAVKEICIAIIDEMDKNI